MPGSTVPVPTGWPTIKTTYDSSLGAKIKTAKNEKKVAKQDVLAGIDYWIARLQEDRAGVVSDY